MTTGGGRSRLTWLGHSTVALDLEGVRLLTDPLLLGNVGPLVWRAPLPARNDWSGASAVLISHLHHDHAHLRSLRLLPDVPVVTAPENARWLRRHGVAQAVGIPEGEPYVVDDSVRVSLTRAVHGHRPMPHRPGAANGHLVQSSRSTVWIAGDTSLFDAMADLPEVAGGPIGLAVVPVGGWAPRLSGGHLGPTEAAQACALVGARAAVPVHWGTLHPAALGGTARGWMSKPGPAFVDALRRFAPECEPIILRPGQSWDLDDRESGP